MILLQTGKDILTELNSKTNTGRPNWDKVFASLKAQQKGKVTVFYCGQPTVAKIIRQKCQTHGFEFCKEVF